MQHPSRRMSPPPPAAPKDTAPIVSSTSSLFSNDLLPTPALDLADPSLFWRSPLPSFPPGPPVTTSSTANEILTCSAGVPPPTAVPVNIDMPLPPLVSTNSSPTDFAFEVPSSTDFSPFHSKDISPTMSHPYASHNAFDLSPNGSGNPHTFGYSSASSFSSIGSVPGSSFSSQDALPAISRDFARPQPSETRRPATASGALLSGGAAAGQRFQKIVEDRPETIAEGNDMFSNPFASPAAREDKQVPSHSEVDPRFIPANRRASEGHFAMQPPQWTSMGPPMASPSSLTPSSQVNQFDLLQHIQQQQQQQSQQQQQLQQQAQRPTLSAAGRPQTSDGLPKFSSFSGVSLPSAKSIAGSAAFPQLTNAASSSFLGSSVSPIVPGQMRNSLDPKLGHDGLQSYRDHRSASMSEISGSRSMPLNGRPVYAPATNSDVKQSSELTFVPLSGPAHKKRPRRRYDEIERLYLCGWQGCEKSYGTLNHLNAHVAMQKHGEKRLPSEFKEMRKAWRKKKREAANAHSSGQNGQFGGSWNRGSISSSSDYDRRDSTSSALSSASDMYGYPLSNYGSWDSRPNTASSTASSIDPRAPFSSTSYAPYGGAASLPGTSAGPVGLGMGPGVDLNSIRRGSAPQHIPMPAFPQGLDGFRPNDGDHPTPTPQNPFAGQLRPNGPQAAAGASFPFQALTQPMSTLAMGPGPNQMYAAGGGQFAFQR